MQILTWQGDTLHGWNYVWRDADSINIQSSGDSRLLHFSGFHNVAVSDVADRKLSWVPMYCYRRITELFVFLRNHWILTFCAVCALAVDMITGDTLALISRADAVVYCSGTINVDRAVVIDRTYKSSTHMHPHFWLRLSLEMFAIKFPYRRFKICREISDL